MLTSEKFLEVTRSLFKVQATVEDGVLKNAENPHFKATYTDLATLWKAVKKPLQDNGILLIQTPSVKENGDVEVETVLLHVESGEWIKAVVSSKPRDLGPQSMGSVITYLKRYSLQSLLAIPSEDDDGNAASKPQVQNNSAPREQQKQTAAPKSNNNTKAATAPAEPIITKETIFKFGFAPHEKKACVWLAQNKVEEKLWPTIGAMLDGKAFAEIGVIAAKAVDNARTGV